MHYTFCQVRVGLQFLKFSDISYSQSYYGKFWNIYVLYTIILYSVHCTYFIYARAPVEFFLEYWAPHKISY